MLVSSGIATLFYKVYQSGSTFEKSSLSVREAGRLLNADRTTKKNIFSALAVWLVRTAPRQWQRDVAVRGPPEHPISTQNTSVAPHRWEPLSVCPLQYMDCLEVLEVYTPRSPLNLLSDVLPSTFPTADGL